MGSTQVPIQYVQTVKRPQREPGHSSATSTEFKNAWRYTSTPHICYEYVVFLSKASTLHTAANSLNAPPRCQHPAARFLCSSGWWNIWIAIITRSEASHAHGGHCLYSQWFGVRPWFVFCPCGNKRYGQIHAPVILTTMPLGQRIGWAL
jgi:hypothetical protein